MNTRIIHLVEIFIKMSDQAIMSKQNKINISLLNDYIIELKKIHSSMIFDEQLADQINNEIEKIIFGLISSIADDKTFNYQLIMYFSDVIIAIIDNKLKENKDINELIATFGQLNVSFNSNKNIF